VSGIFLPIGEKKLPNPYHMIYKIMANVKKIMISKKLLSKKNKNSNETPKHMKKVFKNIRYHSEKSKHLLLTRSILIPPV
tara:strand:- start:97 stop:336 length:240 start_codon:yes stop_codon:yes gene_type:complete